MNIPEMSVEELMERRTAIAAELDAPDADLDALESEVRSINEELETRKAAEAQRQTIRDEVASGAGDVIAEIKEERNDIPMTDIEIRNSDKYIEAFARYIKTGNGEECRSMLSENGSGTVPVPAYVEEKIRTAWENNAILSRVRKTYIRGNLKVPFERSADGAVVHSEGSSAISEENLLLGIVELKPETIKKFVAFSTEAETMGGREFVDYIYDEVIHQVTLKAAAEGVGDIVSASASHSASAVGVPVVKAAPSVTAIPTAAAYLSDEAQNVVVIMNRLTEVEFLSANAAGNFNVDPFAGLPRLYTSALSPYSTLSENGVYAIVGDLDGLQFNFPEGDGVATIYDNIPRKKEDIVEVLGRQYAAHGVTAPGRFCKLSKPAATT
jgi:HK97 family phage major capsid protein